MGRGRSGGGVAACSIPLQEGRADSSWGSVPAVSFLMLFGCFLVSLGAVRNVWAFGLVSFCSTF